MKIIRQSYDIITSLRDVRDKIEDAARTCYRSGDRFGTDPEFIPRLIRKGHTAMLEFADMSVRLVTNRGVTHELVRHRLASYAQESTRYVRYSDIEVIQPEWFPSSSKQQQDTWINAMEAAETCYQNLLYHGWRPEQARDVLPSALRTEIVMKTNIREWRHVLKLRTAPNAHPQIRALFSPLLGQLMNELPSLFGDL